ncbi:hypothetical protein BGX24_005906 [Mortierella sp. AD032]|nr:hypothetical protein BGX24_005906 [Mortierella sp. AD032]
MTDDGAPTPTAATTPTTIATTNSSTTFSSSSSSSFRPRSRATDLLLNLEASSNDARFQEILHNTIALDLFRQFCFQEYSIENLLFWMDVEVFAKPNLEMQRADRLKHKILQKRLEKQQRAYRQQQQQRGRSRTDSKEGPLDEKQQNMQGECGGLDEKENLEVTEEEIKKLKLEVEEEDAQFAVQHARYIYLTYIDTYAPLQVNLSDESRTDIPWPILDANDNNSSNNNNHSRNNSCASKDGKKGSRSRIGSSSGSRTDEVIGWPLDRHMFDGAQEHTYQLMKGHTLVRFEDCELWKSAQRMMHEQPNEYEKATVHGPLNSHYCPDTSVILSTVARSRSRHPTAKLQTLYNWNNSTTDLDRSRDKEEALAKTMSQYFGPIPQSIRHPGRVILGLGPRRHGGVGVGGGFDDDDYEDDEDEFDDFDTFEEHVHGVSGPSPMTANTATTMMSESKRSSASSNGGLGGGFRKNRFTKRLSGRGKGGSGQHHSNASDDLVSGDLYEDSYSMDHHDPSHDGIDSVANGRRTTRWMVAGYFNDQVRLTAAQRKRLLRRNNKLTKFFGSRVDGTLRPVEETEDGGFVVPPSSRSSAAGGVGSLAALGAGGVPMLGSPLAYALSSSTIHDMDRKGRPKKNKSKRDSGNGHEVLFHFPGASKSASGSRSMNLLQKFKRNSGEYYDSSSSTSSNVRSSLFLNTNRKSMDEFGLGSNTSNNTRHFRSATSVDLPQGGRRILAAHPHPLWSGSLSDQEVDSPSAYERRRQLSILSIMGNGLYNSSTSPQSPHATGLTPTTPTEFYASPRGMDQDGGATNKPAHTTGGGSSDRQAMSSRRKKADKLSTFFGAQLTPQELSSQLRMEDDSDLVSATTSQSTTQRQDKNKNDQQQQPVQRSSSESDKHKSMPIATEPSILSVNQLSHRDRTLLWKRSKKLRGILGESLQESEVALSLTIPVLLGSSTRLRNSMSSPRRASTGSPSIRKKRLTGVTSSSSLHGKQASNETQTGDEEVEGEDDSEECEDLNSSSNLVRPKVAKSSSKTRTRRSSNAAAPSSVRARRSSVASNTSSVYRRQSHQHGRSGRANSIPGLNRAISMQSLDSLQSTDTVLDEGDLDDDLRGTEEELGIPRYSHRRRTSSIRPHGYSHLSPRYRQIHATAVLASTCGDGTTTASGAAAAAERINRKKKMDKIQQFLGDRVPEQDLWMGTVGREKTKEMLEKNLFSSCNNVQQDGVSVAGGGAAVTAGSFGAGLSRSATGSKMTPRFKRSTFPGRSKSTSTSAPKSDDCPGVSEKEKSGDNSTSSASTKKSKLRPVVVTTGSRAAGGIRMERSLSDPPRLEDGAGNGLGIRSPGVHQPPYQWHTTVSRLRQQLAMPDAITASALVTSPTVSPPTSFSSSFATSPRLSLSSNTNPGHPTITTKTNVAPTSASAPATASASTSPNSPNNLSPGFMTVMYDEEGEDYSTAEGGEGAIDDESAQILPRLRAMSGKDQERFLKRAEKLERMFGHFPPSALLHRSLTTASSSSSGPTESTATAADGAEREGGHGASRSSEGQEMVYATTSTRGGETSMFQLASFLASATSTQDTNPSSSSSVTSPTTSTSPMTPTSTKKKSEEGKKWISETMEALAEVEWTATRRASATSGEGVVESLVIAPV